jgi:hypothetical protein
MCSTARLGHALAKATVMRRRFLQLPVHILLGIAPALLILSRHLKSHWPRLFSESSSLPLTDSFPSHFFPCLFSLHCIPLS